MDRHANTEGSRSPALAEIYDTDRFAELYHGYRNPPIQNLGLAARYVTSLFRRRSISFAFLGGWAVYLRGGRRRTEDVDVTVACSMEDLKAVMMSEQRNSVCIPQTHGTTSIQIFVFTGGRWDPGFPNTNEYAISIDIIINGYLGTPPDLPNGTELLQPVPATTQGVEAVPVIDLYYQIRSKLQAHYNRRTSGGANDYTDLVFLVGQYGPQIWAFRQFLDDGHRRAFYYDYAARQEPKHAEYLAHVLGLVGDTSTP